MIQRSGDVVIRMLNNVKQATIKPIIEKIIKPKSLIYTDEYAIYDRLCDWGYERKSVCHGDGKKNAGQAYIIFGSKTIFSSGLDIVNLNGIYG